MRNVPIYIGICLLALLSVTPLEASILYTIPVEIPHKEKEPPWSGIVPDAKRGLFQQAVSHYTDGHYAESLSQFRSLTEEGPKGEVSEAATFYIGSIYFKMAQSGDKKDTRLLMNALQAFQDGVRRYPESKNVSRAILEIGKIYLEMNLFEEARGSFERVIKGYPSTRYAAEAQLHIALSHEREGKYREALSEYRILSLRYPGEMEKEEIFGTGRVLFALHEFGAAKKVYEVGLNRWAAYVKGRPEILFNYSECQFQNGEFSRAREGFLILYNIYPGDKKAGFALNRVGDAYMLEQKRGVAEKIYASVLELFPESEDALMSKLALGDLKLLSESGDLFYQEALKNYQEVEESSHDESLTLKARYKIGKLLETQGKYKNALKMYGELLDKTEGPLNKEISRSFLNLTGKIGKEIRDQIGRHDDLDAAKTYQTYFKNIIDHIPDEELLVDVAEVHRRLRLYHEASEIYQKIIDRRGTKKRMALFKMGELYALRGDYLMAVETLGRYISEYPAGEMGGSARALIGESLYNLREYEEASNHFYAVIRESPYRYPDVYIKLSNILQRSGRYEDSVHILKDMIRHLPEKSDRGLLSLAYIALGNAYYGLERYRDALDAYRSGLDDGNIDEGSETVQFMMGDCLLRLNRREEAKNIFLRLSKESKGLIKQSSEERLKDITLGALWGKT